MKLWMRKTLVVLFTIVTFENRISSGCPYGGQAFRTAEQS